MIIDTPAIVAVILWESSCDAILRAIAGAKRRYLLVGT